MSERVEASCQIDSRAALYGADWRWKAAKWRAYESRSRKSANDDCVQRITSLLRMETGERVHGLPADFEAWASGFRQSREIRTHSRDRIILESLMLARCDNREIESVTTVSEEVQAVYRHCYFDLSGPCSSKFSDISIAVELPDGSKEDPLRTAILRLVVHGGRVTALACVDYLRHCDEAHDLLTKLGLQRREIELMVETEYFINGSGPFDDECPVRCFELQMTLDRVRRKRVQLPTVSDLMRRRFEVAEVKEVLVADKVNRDVDDTNQLVELTSFGKRPHPDKKIA